MLLHQSDLQKSFPPHLLIGISAICVLSFILSSLVQYSGVLEFAELKSRMWLPRSRTEISPKIVMVEIDNQTVSEDQLGSLPWAIRIYNLLIWAVNQAQPEAIGLIIWFNREWTEDFLLTGENLFVIRPYNAVDDGIRPLQWQKNDIIKVMSWRNIPKALANAEVKSFSHIALSPEDGLRRKAQIVVKERYSNHYRYSLELLIACRELGCQPSEIKLTTGFWHKKYLQNGERRIPIDKQGKMLVNFAGNIDDFTTISFVSALDLYDSEPQKFDEFFRDKFVLVGITTDEMPRTPTQIGGLTAIEMRANVLNTLVTKNFLTRLDRKIASIIIAAGCLVIWLSSILSYRIQRSSLWILALGSAIALSYLILSALLFYIGLIWLDLVVPFLAIFSCSLFATLYSGYVNLSSLYHKLRKTQTQLVQSEKEAAIGMMSAHVRHEIRNSLNAVRSPAEFVRNDFQKGDPLKLGENPEELIQEMDTIIRQVTRLDEMVENELSYFQNTNFVYQKNDLSQIIFDAIKVNDDVITKKNVAVTTRIPPDLPLIDVDADKLLVAFDNLIKNACQAMPNGGKLTIEINFVSDKRDAYPTDKRDAYPTFVIIFRDTGVGISPENLDKIFEPYHTTKPRGLGLGLTNVKNIITGHRGEIDVKSYRGVGTEFRIKLSIRYA